MTIEARTLAAWSPVRFLIDRAEPVVDWAPMSGVRLSEPFFDQTIERLLGQAPDYPIVRTSLSALADIEAAFPGRDPAALIFHTARCGSTLVSRLAGSLADVAVIAEPGCLNQLLELDPARVDPAVWASTVRLLVRALIRARSEPQVALKLSSWNLALAPLLHEAFPDLPRFLIYRRPAEIVASFLQGPPGWLRGASRADSAITRILALTRADLADGESVACGATSALFKAALEADKAFSFRLLSYAQLPGAIWDEVLPVLGRSVTPHEQQALEQQARWSAKRPTEAFMPDTESKRRSLSPHLTLHVAERLQPLYSDLEQRRATRRAC